MSSKVIYKLYEENRCFGNQESHQKNGKTFIVEDTNMKKLTTHVRLNENKNTSYIILKYISDDLRWRQLGKFNFHKNGNFNYSEKGDLTTTWIRMFYDNEKNIWKESNYRYNDEIVF